MRHHTQLDRSTLLNSPLSRRVLGLCSLHDDLEVYEIAKTLPSASIVTFAIQMCLYVFRIVLRRVISLRDSVIQFRKGFRSRRLHVSGERLMNEFYF